VFWGDREILKSHVQKLAALQNSARIFHLSSYNFVHFHQILCLTNFRIYGKVSLLINILTVNLLGTFKVVQLRFGSSPSLRSGLNREVT